MKKFLIIILLVFAIPFILTGCNSVNNNENDLSSFIIIENAHINNETTTILVHKETRVMYLFVESTMDSSAGLTILVNADGTPMIYEGELLR